MSLTTALKNADGITVPAHELAAAVLLLGESLVTRIEALTAARVPAEAEPDFDQLVTNYQSKTEILKLLYTFVIEKAAVLYQTGSITEAKLRTILGL